MKLSRSILLVVCLFFIAACGGGGGGSSPSSIPPDPSADPIAIDADNAEPVTGAVVETVVAAFDSGEIANEIVLGVSLQGNLDIFEVVDFAADYLKLQPYDLGYNIISGAEVVGPLVLDCEVEFGGAGTVTVSGEMADPEGDFTTGDRLDMDFDQCDLGDGTIFDGGLEIVFNRVSGDPYYHIYDPWQVDMTLTTDQLSMRDGVDSFVIDGDVSVELGTEDGVTFYRTVSGARYSFKEGTGDPFVLREYSITGETVPSTQQVSLRAHGELDIPTFDGFVEFSTNVPFTRYANQDYVAGEMLITGADNSSVLLIAYGEPEGLVRLEIDTDGDGHANEIISTDWDTLVQ